MAGLEDLYREIILDHYRSPRNRGELDTPPAHRVEGFNPLCGDEIIVYLQVNDAGIIDDVAIAGQGCSISQSSASMMSVAIKGKTIEQARKLIVAFKGLMSIHENDIGGDGSETALGIDLAPKSDPSDTASGTDDIKLGDLEALRGVVKFPIRIKCATLSWNTLAQALDEATVA